MHSIDLFHLFQMYSFLPIGFREMVKYCLEDFFRSKLPTHVFAKDCFLTAQEQACNRFIWLFVFWVLSQCRLPVTKNTLETLTKSSSSSCGNNWSQIFFSFATHLLLEHLSAQLDTAATAHSALRHNVRVLQAYLVKKTFPKCSFTWNPTLLICRCTL